MIFAMVALIIFWVSLAILIYTFAGYPVLISLLAVLFSNKRKRHIPFYFPRISIVLVVFNESRRILARIQNLLDTTYPRDFIKLVIVSDGSTDGTDDIVMALNDPQIKLVRIETRSGKSAGVNLGAQNASGDIIVFCDARQRFDVNTIQELISHFSDPEVGAVSGSLEIDPASSTVGSGVDIYWRIEKKIRYAESLLDSCIGCTGAVYAIRKDLFEPLPADTILDDVVIPMKIATKGYRVVFEPSAMVFDPQSLEPKKEKIRKERTLAGNFQMLFRYPQWLLPWENRLFFQLISHKYLRLLGPFLLIAIFISNLFLTQENFYMISMIGQFLFYYLAFIGFLFKGIKFKPVSIPAGFVFLNWQVVAGLMYYLKNRGRQCWTTLNEHSS